MGAACNDMMRASRQAACTCISSCSSRCQLAAPRCSQPAGQLMLNLHSTTQPRWGRSSNEPRQCHTTSRAKPAALQRLHAPLQRSMAPIVSKPACSSPDCPRLSSQDRCNAARCMDRQERMPPAHPLFQIPLSSIHRTRDPCIAHTCPALQPPHATFFWNPCQAALEAQIH